MTIRCFWGKIFHFAPRCTIGNARWKQYVQMIKQVYLLQFLSKKHVIWLVSTRMSGRTWNYVRHNNQSLKQQYLCQFWSKKHVFGLVMTGMSSRWWAFLSSATVNPRFRDFTRFYLKLLHAHTLATYTIGFSLIIRSQRTFNRAYRARTWPELPELCYCHRDHYSPYC